MSFDRTWDIYLWIGDADEITGLLLCYFCTVFPSRQFNGKLMNTEPVYLWTRKIISFNMQSASDQTGIKSEQTWFSCTLQYTKQPGKRESWTRIRDHWRNISTPVIQLKVIKTTYPSFLHSVPWLGKTWPWSISDFATRHPF